jgi:hypothetical protein
MLSWCIASSKVTRRRCATVAGASVRSVCRISRQSVREASEVYPDECPSAPVHTDVDPCCDQTSRGGNVGGAAVVTHVVHTRQTEEIGALSQPDELSFDVPAIRMERVQEGLHPRVVLHTRNACGEKRRHPEHKSL